MIIALSLSILFPPDAREMSNLQDIFYSSLAFELLPYNSKTQTYQLEYYDSLRDTHEVTSLSHVWDEALEKLASLQDMVEALDAELNKTIADITHNPQKWQGDYLPKLRKFVATVDDLPEDDPNYLYKETVVGTRVGTGMNTKQQDGIVNRFWRRMEEIVREELEKYNQKQKQQKLQGSANSDRILSGSQTSQAEEAIEAEIEDSNNSSVNSQDGMEKLRELIQMKQEGFLSEAEFKAAKSNILGIENG